MSSSIERIGTWARRNSYVLKIAAGQLYDDVLGRALVNGDAFTMGARAYVDNDLVTPTTISGVGQQSFSWTGTQWLCELPYASAFDTLATVRVIATLTAGSVTHDLMDARVTIVKADGG